MNKKAKTTLKCPNCGSENMFMEVMTEVMCYPDDKGRPKEFDFSNIGLCFIRDSTSSDPFDMLYRCGRCNCQYSVKENADGSFSIGNEE